MAAARVVVGVVGVRLRIGLDAVLRAPVADEPAEGVVVVEADVLLAAGSLESARNQAAATHRT